MYTKLLYLVKIWCFTVSLHLFHYTCRTNTVYQLSNKVLFIVSRGLYDIQLDNPLKLCVLYEGGTEWKKVQNQTSVEASDQASAEGRPTKSHFTVSLHPFHYTCRTNTVYQKSNKVVYSKEWIVVRNIV